MPEIDAISVAHADLVSALAQRFDVREVTDEFDEPMVILATALPMGQTLVHLEDIGMEAAGSALVPRGGDRGAVYALYAQGMTP